MKILEKEITLGEMKFRVGTDRNIAVKVFEQNPDLIEFLFNNQDGINNDKDFFINALKKKELNLLFSMEDKFQELIDVALPLMLEKARDNSDAKEIIKYAQEGGASSIMNSALLGFLCEGFTQSEPVKPKIKFAMK